MFVPHPANSSDSGAHQHRTPQRGHGLRFLLACALALSLAPLQLASVAYAANFVVTKTADTNDGACNADCSLREAIIAANTTPGPDTITFSVNGTFAITLNPGPDENDSATGDFDILTDITIIGNGAANTIIDGQDLDRVFDIDPFGLCNASTSCTVALSNMTIRNGRAFVTTGSVGGAIFMGSRSIVTITNSVIESSSSATSSGGGIQAAGALTLNNVTIQDNVALANGGGINSIGNLTISNSTFLNNQAEFGGGLALLQNNTRTVSISDSTFSGNRSVITGGGATDDGGAIYALTDTTITITGSTFSANTSANDGGGLFLQDSATVGTGTFNLTNNTISGNRADGAGGGIYIASGNATITNVTITQNHSDNNNAGGEAGGGLRVAGGAVTLNDTIVAENYRGSGTATIDNVNGTIGGSNNLTSGTPLLGPLANNGGSTQTHALLAGSPAINAGNNATCAATDQRGVARPVGGICDIGAYELTDLTPPDTTITSNPLNPSSSSTATFTFIGSDSGGSGLAGFQCRIDGGSFTPCTSPQTYVGLSDGSHTFEVRAVDGVGNVDPTPTGFTWVIDTTPPPAPVVITPANGSITNNTQPLVSGTAEANSTVTVFIDGTAAGTTTADGAGNWNFTPPTPLSNGSHTVRARATDAVGNTSVDSNTNTFTVDTVAPDTTITANPPNPSNSANATFTFTGSDPGGSGVAGFECQIDGGSFTPCTSPQTYVGLSNGSHTFEVRAVDNAGNIDGTPASFTWVVDTTAPAVAFSSAAPDPTNVSPIPVTVTFNESVTGFTAADISVSNGTVSNFAGSGTTYTFDLVPAGQGLVTADIAAGVAQDAAGNGNTAADQFSRTYDSVAPAVTVNQAAGQPDPTGIAPINFTVVFDEPVTGFGDSAADVIISGTAGATTATVTGSGTTYNVAITGMTAAGTVVVTIPAGAAQDLATNPSAASTSTDNTVNFDPVAPVVTGIVRADPSPTNAASVQFIVTFSKNVTGVDASDFALTLSGVSGASVTDVTGSGTTWTVTVNTGTGDGTLRLALVDDDSITDVAANPLGGSGAGNGDFSAGQVYTIDKSAPAVASIVRAGANPTNAASVAFTVTFSEIVIGVDEGDFALTLSGVSGASVSDVTGGGTTWTVTVNTGTGDGTIRLDLVDDDSIVDVIANPLGGSGAGNGDFSAGEFYTIDKTAPTAGSLVTPQVTSGSTTFSLTVVFSDNLAIDVGSLDDSDIRVSGPNGFSQLATLVSVSPASDGTPRTATYQITPPGGAWDTSDDGNYTVSLEATQVFDTAGNPAAATDLGSFQISLSYTTYLPLMHSEGHPDLVVERIVASGNSIQVVIRNQGSAPATGTFWVDLYINPDRPPTSVNETWDTQGSQGLAWGITGAALPLDPGESLTLTIGDAYFQAERSSFSGTLPAGTPLYAQVDSANALTSYGGVLESHELSGGAYNNILGPVLSGSVALPPVAAKPTGARVRGLPAR